MSTNSAETPEIAYAGPATPERDAPPMSVSARRSLTAGLLFFLTPIPSLLAIAWGVVGIRHTCRQRVRGEWAAWTGSAFA